MDNFLGVEITNNKCGSISVTQPHLTTRFLELLNIESDKNSKDTPAIKAILFKDKEGPRRKYDWNYRTGVSMLTYLSGSTRPYISMSVHQCARFYNFPRLLHEREIRRIGKYLLGTRNEGINFVPH